VVVGAAPVAYLAFSALVDPSSVALLVGTPAGQVCLALGIGLDVLAIVWMRRVVRDDAA
jgi:Flp pilus assembly protein TadB